MIDKVRKAIGIKNEDFSIIKTEPKRFRFKVKDYNVECNNNSWSCSCPDYEYRHEKDPDGAYICKHIMKTLFRLGTFNKDLKIKDKKI